MNASGKHRRILSANNYGTLLAMPYHYREFELRILCKMKWKTNLISVFFPLALNNYCMCIGLIALPWKKQNYPVIKNSYAWIQLSATVQIILETFQFGFAFGFVFSFGAICHLILNDRSTKCHYWESSAHIERYTNCKNEYDECLVQEICKNATNATA